MKKKIDISKICIYILLILILFHDSFVKAFNINFLNNLDELIIVALVGIDICNIILLKKCSKFKLTLLGLTMIFSGLGILSCYVNSEFITSRVLLSNFLAIKFFLLILAIADWNISEKLKKNIIECLENISKIVIIVAIFNLIQPVLYKRIFSFAITMKRFGLLSVTSLFYHTGKYGWFMLFMALLYYSKYKTYKNKKDKSWMIVCGIASLFSFRTKVIMSMIIIFIVINIMNKKISVKKIVYALVFLTVIYISFGKVINNTYNLYFSEKTGVSARKSLNQNGMKIVKDYFPLGVGFGKYGSWYAKVYYSEYYVKYNMSNINGLTREDSSYATDTFWPSVFGETGIIGGIVYIGTLVYIFYTIWKLLKKEETNIGYVYKYLAMFALIQSVCESFGEPSFNSAPQNIILGLIIALAINQKKVDGGKNGKYYYSNI